MESLKQKVAIVTGGTSGIGRSACFRLAKEGAKVVVSSRNQNVCDEVAEEINNSGGCAKGIACDVSDEMAVTSLFRETECLWGGVDVLIASAGISGGSTPVEQYDFETWKQVINVNLSGMFLQVREAFRKMKKRGGGSIVVLSSQAGVEGYARKGAYCASKFGVRGLAQSLAEEGRKYGIRVTALCPGTVDTPILAATNTRVENPLTTDAIADAIVYLASLRGNTYIRDVVIERMLKS